ncbi:MAG TPA: MFS transporter, partial [Actinomycetota bacterium]|nr:MFS transporter [Actinomycetota bacterium]
MSPGAPSSPTDPRRRRLSFLAVNGGYLAATAAESLLAPVLPLAARELRLDVADAGLAFATLAGAIALGNLVGGVALSRSGPKPGAVGALLVSATAALLVAAVRGRTAFLACQALVGLGSGAFFASGLYAAGAL